jgi:hypothetical protein
MKKESKPSSSQMLYLTDDILWSAHDLALLEERVEIATGIRMILNEIYGNPNLDKNQGDTVGPLLKTSEMARHGLDFIVEHEQAIKRLSLMMRVDLFVANVGLRGAGDSAADEYIELCRRYFEEMVTRYDAALGPSWMIEGQSMASMAMCMRIGFFRTFQVGIKGSDEGVEKLKNQP